MDQTEALAEDTLADILGCLPPRDLAASRCVRKSWRATVGAHGLLLPHVLPRSVRGLFLNYSNHVRPRFLAGPSSTRQLPATIHGDLGFLPNYGGGSKPIMDHCNGLLLYRDLRTLLVVNPAMRRWEDLTWEDASCCDAYLAFDPAVSLHYEVFSVPHVPEKAVLNPSMPGDEGSESEDGSSPEYSEEEDDLSTTTESSGEQENPQDLMECPPSLWTLNVFSSSTRQWEKRTFVRQAVAKGTVTNMLLDPTEPRPLSWGGPRCTCSAYWRGSLYVHFRGVFVVRLSISDGKYQIMKTPIDTEECDRVRPYIGKSENGVYFATMCDKYRLQVWTLMESSDKVYWVSKHLVDLEPCATRGFHPSDKLDKIRKTWIFDDYSDVDGNNKRLTKKGLNWDSDDDNIVNIEDVHEVFCMYVWFLGFHPYKEVVFLGLASLSGAVVAYHLNSSKFQYLGSLHMYREDHSYCISGSFPCTPCMTGHLLKQFPE